MSSIIIKPLLHKGNECFSIHFHHNQIFNTAVRKVPGIKWSQSNKCWYLLLTKDNYLCFSKMVGGQFEIDNSALKNYLYKKKNRAIATASSLLIKKIEPETISITSEKTKNISIPSLPGIHPVNVHVLPALKEYLKLKAYSESTAKTYTGEITQFLKTINHYPANELQIQHIKKYLVYCYSTLGLKENTLHSRINALKFYYEQVLKRDKFFWEIPRPKKAIQLPKLLNEKELSCLFNALANKKHKAMLFTVYSAGLRVSEIVNLKIADIDSKRMQIFICRAKGKKDRYVNLSPLLLDILRQYIKEYNPRPKEYLFESERTGMPYPARTVQQIFSNAKIKAGIRKQVGIHSLRHSFATHLLDKGTDIKYIKDLLGHFNIKTTERYLHVSRRQLVNIISPFDDLMKSGTVEW